MGKKRRSPAERKRLMRERSFKIYFKVACFFVVFVLLVNILNLIIRDKEYSETENRMLSQFPKMTVHNLTSGAYMRDMEAYITDQFVARDAWIQLKLTEDMVLGRRESNGVYIGKERSLLEIPSEPDMVHVDQNLEAIKTMAGKHRDIRTVMTLVPNAAWVCDQLRPFNAPVRDQSEDIAHAQEVLGSTVHFVDPTEALKAHKDEMIYYKTDHHWTSLGARYAFDDVAKALAIQNTASEYTVYPVTRDFQGTLAAKSGYTKTKDTIEIFIPRTMNNNYAVHYIDEGEKSSSLYVSAALDQRDKYEVFLGGNHTRVDILTTAQTERNLLVIKDSYANCFIQFLTPYFDTITIVDPRYYCDDLEMLIRDKNVTDILYLYNVNTFLTDTSLADVLIGE